MTAVKTLVDKFAGTHGVGAESDSNDGEAAAHAVMDVQVQQIVAAVSADASAETIVFRNMTGFPLRLKSASLVSDGTLTANGSNYAEITVSHGSAGDLATAAFATTDSDVTAANGGTGDWVADTPENLLLTAANAQLDAGDLVHVLVDSTPGSGVAVPKFLLCLKYERA